MSVYHEYYLINSFAYICQVQTIHHPAYIHFKLTGGKEYIELIYEPSTGDLSFEQALNNNDNSE